MTTDKAIKRLRESIAEIGNDKRDSLTEAEMLGIEALKRIEWYRKYEHINHDALLPGETKD